MSYIQITFQTENEEVQGIIIAILSEHGYEGFEEQETELKAYVPVEHFNEELLHEFITPYGIIYTKENIEEQNWNAKWEENFQPVIIDDFCSITAHFHKIDVNTTHHIQITPKMSFGTGHHATTRLMIKAMRNIDFNNKTVFDFGTGTGVLAILADRLGASNILAIDNDEWAYLNAKDNIEVNNAVNVVVKQAVLDDIPNLSFDVILANINRHILLQYMAGLKKMLAKNGKLLMSGLLTGDEGIIVDVANNSGLQLLHRAEDNNWIVLELGHA